VKAIHFHVKRVKAGQRVRFIRSVYRAGELLVAAGENGYVIEASADVCRVYLKRKNGFRRPVIIRWQRDLEGDADEYAAIFVYVNGRASDTPPTTDDVVKFMFIAHADDEIDEGNLMKYGRLYGSAFDTALVLSNTKRAARRAGIDLSVYAVDMLG